MSRESHCDIDVEKYKKLLNEPIPPVKNINLGGTLSYRNETISFLVDSYGYVLFNVDELCRSFGIDASFPNTVEYNSIHSLGKTERFVNEIDAFSCSSLANHVEFKPWYFSYACPSIRVFVQMHKNEAEKMHIEYIRDLLQRTREGLRDILNRMTQLESCDFFELRPESS